MNIITIKVKY